MECLDTLQRESTLSELENGHFDLIIIGGGITGAGVLREAALRGLKCALLEADDFACGTSSKSTKLIHGGLRYLAMGHIHVVREGARERKRVHQLAPHLAEPKWLMVPARNQLEAWKYQIGVTLYEHLGLVDPEHLHFNLSGQALHDFEPTLNIDNFPKACVYREYLTDDARLVLANIRAGVELGGVAVNQLKVVGLVREGNKIVGVKSRCGLTGRELVTRCQGVINAAGPWVEQICALDDTPMPKNMVLSKGVHVAVAREKLPLRHMVFTVAEDGRPVFAIPRGESVYIGTTDSTYPGVNIWPEVLPAEVQYLFRPIEKYFGVKLDFDDCFTSWAGLRPLISQAGKSTKEISRKDEVWVAPSGLVTVAGGKLTGYRKMAEDTVSRFCSHFNIETRPLTDDQQNRPLPGGDFAGDLASLACSLMSKFSITGVQSERMARLYGSEAIEILNLDASLLGAGGELIAGEVDWAVGKEAACSIEDIFYRRARLAIDCPNQVEKQQLINAIASRMSEKLGWDATKQQLELDRIHQRLSLDLAFSA